MSDDEPDDEENPFGEALGEAQNQQDANSSGGGGDAMLAALAGEFDVDEFIDGLDEGAKSETIGLHVPPDLKAVYDELRKADDVDVDVTEQLRQHLLTLAERHKDVTRRAGLKQQIDDEL